MKELIKQSMRKSLWVPVICFLLFAGSCKKDEGLPTDEPASLSAFSIESENKPAIIDEHGKTITVSIGDLMDWQNLKVTFTASNAGQLIYESQTLASGTSTLDFTKPVELTLRSPNGIHQDSWKVVVNSAISDYGLGSILYKAASVDKGHNYYFDQGGTGAHQYINCGPAVTTMAIKWGDASFTRTPQDARASIHPNGGWWFTNDIASYFTTHGIKFAYTGLGTEISVSDYGNKIISIIDKGYAIIVCLDMFYVNHEQDINKRINKFYTTASRDWGHFMLVKGYKVVDNTVWLEIHDPYSLNQRYGNDNQLKGENRYYAAGEIKKATDVWWPHAMVVAPRGTDVVGVSVLPPNSVNTLMHQRGR